jgi:hypothetical protein
MARHDVDPVLQQLVRAINESRQAAVRCTFCAPKCGLVPVRRDCLRTGSRMWSWPCTNWRPTCLATAGGKAGCGYGIWREHCTARLTTAT